jgi:hypothetical protein
MVKRAPVSDRVPLSEISEPLPPPVETNIGTDGLEPGIER